MKAVGYVRVSKFTEKSVSPEQQKTAIEKYCRVNGYDLLEVFSDLGISGEKMRTRPQMQRLISLAYKQAFNAVVVYKLDRFSRNSADQQIVGQNLALLGITIFSTTEGKLDYSDADSEFHANLLSVFAHHERKKIGQRTKASKLLLAKKGDPAGRKPWGRTFSKDTGWGIDREKQILIRNIARRFLEGESLTKIAAENKQLAKKRKDDLYTGICGYTSLLRVLKERSGPNWYRTDRHPFTKKVQEKIHLEVPELLDANTRKAIANKIAENKTFNGERKHRYLLKGHLFCAHCGSPLSGESVRDRRYYRHKWKKHRCPKFFNSVRADIIEEPLILELFQLFGDKKRIDKAIKAAIPDPSEREALLKERTFYEKNLKKDDDKINNAVNLILESDMHRDIFDKKIEQLKASKAETEIQIQKIDEKLAAIPEAPDVVTLRQLGLKKRFFKTQHQLRKMTYDALRTMIKEILGGTDADGNRYGVYVKKTPKGHYTYEIRGALLPDQLRGAAPLSIRDKKRLFGYGPDEHLDEKVFKTVREHECRPAAGIFQRRADGGHHYRSFQNPETVCDCP